MDKKLSGFTESKRNQAFERYNKIKPFLEDNTTIREISNNEKISYSTLYRWVKKYRENGLTGLVDERRSDNGKGRIVKDEIKLLVEGLALQKPKPSIASIHRKIVKIAETKDWRKPSYTTIRNIIKGIKPSVITLAHEGDKAYKDNYDLLHSRKANYPNEIWQADHSLLDIWLVDNKENIVRPWLTIIMDHYSRAIAGYFLFFNSPSSQKTSLALHQAIWYKKNPEWSICGIPEIFYTDHGSDFTSLHMKQVSADIKMNLVFSLPGQPRGRGVIERFFSTINQLFLCELYGYSTNVKYLKKESLMKIDEFEELLKNFLINDYNNQVHSETKMEPQKMWKSGAFIPNMPKSLEELDLLLLTEAKTRKVHQDGIHFQKIKYTEPTLSAYVGEEVVIRYDPRDIAEIRIFHEGKFLCRALNYEMAGEKIELKDVLKARNRIKKELKKEIENRKEFASTFLESNNKENSINENKDAAKENKPKKRKLKRYFNE